MMNSTIGSAVLLVLLLGIAVAPASPADPAPAKAAAKGKANRLINESSPYLLQHAYNPVDWYPWGPQAFEKARKENKLIFLSIGYSSCHWCHVMERESFANAEIAKVLNEHFVCIKVDREERPDVDEVYMTALLALDTQGGWPLSMFLLPDGKPIIGGTYFPPEDRVMQGVRVNGFKTILFKMRDVWKEQPEGLRRQADAVAAATRRMLQREFTKPVEPSRELVHQSVRALLAGVDPVHGGFGRAERDFRGTKFPMPPSLRLLLGDRDNKETQALIHLTLEKMAHGGIYDQLGGGFHRYSTERTWTVPHFEKMLYDNGQLLEVYAEAFARTPKPLYQRILRETAEFLRREMTSPDGGFYSALDADSNGNEGEFYVWKPSEISQILGKTLEADLFAAAFGQEPNFEEHFLIPTRRQSLDALAQKFHLTEAEVQQKLDTARRKLFDARAKRERPFLDTKILTSWNGQTIAGLARAGQVLQDADYLQRASKAADFILKHLRTPQGQLLRTYSRTADGKGEARIPGYLDDYTYFVHGLLTLHEATQEARWLTEAKKLTDIMIELFADDKGGFFFTSPQHEQLFARIKDAYDGVQPSGNSVAVRNLIRLHQQTREAKYLAQAKKSFAVFLPKLEIAPTSMPTLAEALALYLDATGAAATPTPKEPPQPMGIPRSDSVVKVTPTVSEPKNGVREVKVILSITQPFHIYAHPIGSKELEGAETKLEFYGDGKKLAAEVTYPKGTLVKDSQIGDYFIYAEEVTLTAKVPTTGPMELRLRVQACNEQGCLLPATIKMMLR